MNPGGPDWLLCADLDGTILGDPSGEDAFRRWAERRGSRIALAYVTGRSAHNVRAFVAEGRLPEPDCAATDIGTDLALFRGHPEIWRQQYLAMAPPAWPAELIREWGASPETPLQEARNQGTFKASFYWDGSSSAREGLERRLAAIGGWRLSAVAGRYLDVLPPALGKGPALRFLSGRFGVGLERVAAAGDMEHDLEMLSAAGEALVPANALAPVLEAASAKGWFVSSRPEAWGLLDGLARLGLA
jgi:hydroxymethylpyrimidine pyrophosphatase-like HAD family hydrolase